jgi:hypothetical protein
MPAAGEPAADQALSSPAAFRAEDFRGARASFKPAIPASTLPRSPPSGVGNSNSAASTVKPNHKDAAKQPQRQ